MNFGLLFLIAIIVGGGIGVIFGATLLYALSEEMRWKNFLDRLDRLIDNPATRWFFDTSMGRALNRKTIEAHVRTGKAERAGNIAVREGLVDETIVIFEDFGRFLEGAHLARRMGRDEAALRLFRREIDAARLEGRAVHAAEVAEEAGFWEEAVERLEKLQGRTSRLKAAQLASEHGLPEKAVKLFLMEEALLDAMRVAEENGMLDFVLTYCEKSNNAVLHQFGADAARRAGDPERGIAILENNGLLHEAALFARESQLPERAEELLDKLKKKKLESKLKRLGGDPEDPIWGPGPVEAQPPPRKEEILEDIEMPKMDEEEGEGEKGEGDREQEEEQDDDDETSQIYD